MTQPNQYVGLNNINKDALYQQCGVFSDDIVKLMPNLPDFTNGALYFRRPDEKKRVWHNCPHIKLYGYSVLELANALEDR